MAEKSLDIETLKLIVGLMKPAPVAPVAPVTSVQPAIAPPGTETMASDIKYLTKSMDEVKVSIGKITDTHVTITDAQKHIDDDNKIHEGIMKRLEALEGRQSASEINISRLYTVGSTVLFFISAAEVIISHFWK